MSNTDITTLARLVLEEVFPADDEARLAELISPVFVNHEAPPGTPPGLGSITFFMHLLAGRSRTNDGPSTRRSSRTTPS